MVGLKKQNAHYIIKGSLFFFFFLREKERERGRERGVGGRKRETLTSLCCLVLPGTLCIPDGKRSACLCHLSAGIKVV